MLADKAIFKHCRFLGYQDTLFANWGRQYYVESYIAGAVDFIFGNATAVFDRVEIQATAPGYITAQSRLRADETTGFVIRDSRIATVEASGGGGGNTSERKVALGRPWRPFSRVVYLRTAMDVGIAPEGFGLWRKGDDPRTMFYAEAGSSGSTALRRVFDCRYARLMAWDGSPESGCKRRSPREGQSKGGIVAIRHPISARYRPSAESVV